MTIDIDTLTTGEAKRLTALFAGLMVGDVPPVHDGSAYPIPVGTLVCIETIMPHYVGVLVAVSPTTITLSKAAWVPDTGRWSEFAKDTSTAKEVEPLPENVPLCIERSAIISVRVQPGAILSVRK